MFNPKITTGYMHQRFIMVVMSIIMTFGIALSAKEKQDSYNMRRALECVDDNDFDKALEYAKLEISENPKNAEAFNLLGYLYYRNDENGKALSSLNDAIRLYPKKEKSGIARSRYYRSQVYLQLKDTIPAIEDLKIAIKLIPNDRRSMAKLADLYFITRCYSEADAIYHQMQQLHPGDPYPYYGLARTASNEGRYEDAKALIERSRLLDMSSIMPDILLMRMYRNQNSHKNTLESAINVLKKDISDDEACYTIMCVADSIPDVAIAALRKAAFDNKEHKWLWNMLQGDIWQQQHHYSDAVKAYEEMLDDGDMKGMAVRALMDCYEEMEYPEKVEELANTYLEMYPDNANALLKRADARFFMQRHDEAKEDYKQVMEIEPEYGYFCYYRLGWIAEMQGDYDQALKDYDMSITLNDGYPYVQMMKGNLLIDYLGSPDRGREIMQRVIEVEEIQEDGCCLQYAYVALGERDKAIEAMDSIIALNPNNVGNYYDAACVYSRLHEKGNALKYLRLALQKGYRKFRHIDQDDDMDYIRDTPEFRALIEEFDKPIERSETESRDIETVVYEIPLIRQPGGTYLIKASINDLPMEFVLDTGCSDVSLSQVESDFMLKNGYMKQSDMRGNQRYTDANGNTNISKTVNLAKIKIGDLEVNNIRAGIIPNQKAPLLLGQQVLNKFSKVEIDHTHNLLRITVIK